ncbi:MAG: PAS domain-containing protein [Candidatus Melainabacteria bacterium]|nr:PAS domain-containing protein [Candidatus Melainabacteria bacterium]
MTALLTSAYSSTVETLLSDIDVGILITDTTGLVLFVNQAATNILGISREQTPLVDWPGLYLPDAVTSLPYEQSPLYRAIHGQEAERVELFVASRSRSALGRWVRINFRPMRNESGDIEGAALAIKDITAERKSSIEAQRSNEALQRFASVAAHDLQEPLRSVTGFVDLLAEETETELNENCIHYMKRIKAAVARMRNLINDLLAYSRIQSVPHEFTPVDCNKVLEKCLDNLNASITESEAIVESSDLPTVSADASQLAQLLQNLIGNALKFATKDQHPHIQIAARREAQWWIFSVRDNGIGVEMQFAERIFVLFQKLHASTAYSGTGMGLAICKRIVEGHGGRIWMESEPGVGSTFLFSLPASNYLEEVD